MLSLLAAQLLNVPRHISEQDDEEAIVNVGLFTICTDVGRPQSVDVDALKALVPPLPNVRWRAVAGMCGQAISPMYKSIQNMLHEDSEHVARLFSELEPLFSDDDNEASDLCMRLPHSNNEATGCIISNSLPDDLLLPGRRRHKWTGSSTKSDHPLIIPSTHTSIPTIIISPPCLTQPSETLCRAPFQDSSFGNRLTLPTHPAFNEAFPPLIPTPYPPAPVIQSWMWVDGHWQVVLPTLEEQARKGMFSRALIVRRKSCRNTRCTP